jgi:pimeloyl-ACP methyl ester carboxylesterase
MISKFAIIDTNNRIHYLVGGQGPTLILLPSFGISSFSYTKMGELLSKYFTVYIVDLYRGKSVFAKDAHSIEDYVQALTAFLQTMRISTYVIVGISYSGFIIAKLFDTTKFLPKKVFLLSTAIVPVHIRHTWLKFAFGYWVWFVHNLFSWSGLLVNVMCTKDFVYSYKNHISQVFSDARIVCSLPVNPRTSVISPTMVYVAANDEFLPMSVYHAMQHIKNVTLKVYNGYHSWFLKHEEQIVPHITEFLKI